MKKHISSFLLMLLPVLAFLFMHSCVNDDYCDCEKATAENLTLHLSMTKDATRAIPTEAGEEALNETHINTLDLFFYTGNTLKWRVKATDLAYNAGTNIATIPIPEDKKTLFKENISTEYQVYGVANNTADLASIVEGADNLAALKNLVLQSDDFVSKGGSEAQPSFVMDGLIRKIINLNDPALGTLNLKRAASKIRLRVVQIAVPGYDIAGEPTARLVHFTHKSALMNGGAAPSLTEADWQTSSDRNITTNAPADLGGGKTTAAPFYAYANNWQNDAARETYLELFIPLKDDHNNTNTYKYRVPLTPQNLTGEDAQYMNKLDRNLLYDIAVVVKILGGVDERPVDLTGNYTILDWETQEVLVDIKGAHYLVVSERNVIMPNIANYTLTFNSSIADVKLVPNSLKATFTYVDNTTGTEKTKDYFNPGTGDNVVEFTAQRPQITIQPNVASGTIIINSKVPVNYIPKDIEFKITNSQLTETITIKQLAATYFTTQLGVKALGEDGSPITTPPGNLKNKYMYVINTLAPAGNIIWGFPPIENGFTANNLEVSRMVSPKFMMASQLGAVFPMSFSNARNRCNNYWEQTVINGVTVTYDDWRLPTAAEIEYIDNLQHDTNSAQNTLLMHAIYYWSNWDLYPTTNDNGITVYGAYKMKNGTNTGASYNNAHIRCIRDIKD